MTRQELMRRYKAEGHTSKEVAEMFGVTADYARHVCSGVAPQGQSALQAETVAQRVADKSDGKLKYISGYENKQSPIVVECLICGERFERTYHHITTHPNDCPCCAGRERAERKAQADAERTRKKFRTDANRSKRNSQLRLVVCGECGDVFLAWNKLRKYCCKDCGELAAKRIASYNRGSDDRLDRSNIVDRDIDLRKLFERDHGICQICGERCDYSDYYYNDNGVFIAGDKYPSKDHIVPLSMGGKHAWNNVRLAHRQCNTKFYQNIQRFMPSWGVKHRETP